MHRFVLIVAVGCSSKREPEHHEPAPSKAPVIDAITIDAPEIDAAPQTGALLRTIPLDRDQPPYGIVAVGDALYYGTMGSELWVYRDGTASKVAEQVSPFLNVDREALYFVTSAQTVQRQVFGQAPSTLAKNWDGGITAVDDTHVYLTSYVRKGAARVPKTGGKIESLPCSGNVVPAGDWLYCQTASELSRFDKSGKQKTVLARSKLRLVEGPAVTEKFAYASTEGKQPADWTVVRVPLAGGTFETVSPDAGDIGSLEAVGAEAYWIQSPEGGKVEVRRMSDADAKPFVFAQEFTDPRHVAVGESSIFVTDAVAHRIVELKR